MKAWLEKRVGGELEVARDDRGTIVLRMRGARLDSGDVGGRDMTAREFYDSLPQDRFTADEEALRTAILGFLDNWDAKDAPLLADMGADPEVRSVRIRVLRRAPAVVTVKEWAEKRMGGEIEIVIDSRGQQIIRRRISGLGRSPPRKRPRDEDDGWRGDRDRGSGKGGGKRGKADFQDRDRGSGKAQWKVELDEFVRANRLAPKTADELYRLKERDATSVMGTDGGKYKNRFVLDEAVRDPDAVILSRIKRLPKEGGW